MKTFVVIATYNEKGNIERLLNQILALNLPELKIIVVDDNSPDGTADIVKQKFNNPVVELLLRVGRRGYGSAHIEGFQKATQQGAEIIISMDADFSHQPIVIPTMINEINNGADLVVGSRRVAGGKIIGWGFTRILASNTAMILTRTVLGVKTKDVTSGFRAYRVSRLNEIKLETIKSNGYSFLEELIYYCEKQNFKIAEIPIIFNDRELGKSKFSSKEIIKFFITIFKLRLGKK